MEIGEFLSLNKEARAARLRNKDLVVLRDLRIDNLGETATLYEVRKRMHDLLGDIKDAVGQLTRLGIRHFVIATDHGHLVFPEVQPEDIFPAPDGVWLLTKRRVLLGSQLQSRQGVLSLDAPALGIQGDAETLATPRGFGVFTAGSGYFHGGLSLQECVVPLLELRADAPIEPSGWGSQVQLTYHKESFSSRALSLKALLISMAPDEQKRVRVEAYARADPKAPKVGEATECDARDEVTHEIVLRAGEMVAIPMLLDSDFAGAEIEIRAVDSESVVLHRLRLKNGMLD
jgi:hypothetical protein